MRKLHFEEKQGVNRRQQRTRRASMLPHSPAPNTASQARSSGGISGLPRAAESHCDAVVRRERGSSQTRLGDHAAAGGRAAELAHDARNLLSALSVYCDLLAGPGVLAPGFRHYAEDLRRVGETGARLVAALANPTAGLGSNPRLPLRRRPILCIEDLAAEVLALEAPLRALAGPAVRLEVECAPCAGLLGLNSEELLRILFNLVANAVEALGAETGPPGQQAFLRITAQRGGGASFLSGGADGVETVALSVRDNGPGIAAEGLGHIFDPGFSTRSGGGTPHGLGLAIVRQLAEAAGGAVRAVSSPGWGTRFDIELPVLTERTALRSELSESNGHRERGWRENGKRRDKAAG